MIPQTDSYPTPESCSTDLIHQIKQIEEMDDFSDEEKTLWILDYMDGLVQGGADKRNFLFSSSAFSIASRSFLTSSWFVIIIVP